MKTIYINSKKHGLKEVLVDDEDYEQLNQFKWSLSKCGLTFYAVRRVKKIKNIPLIKMHRDIMKSTDINELCDHIDHNGLNNQKCNLRKCNKKENNRNRTSRGYSKYLGVSLHIQKYNNEIYWRARIKFDKKAKHLGLFNTQEEAALAYDAAAKIHFGGFANLNFT